MRKTRNQITSFECQLAKQHAPNSNHQRTHPATHTMANITQTTPSLLMLSAEVRLEIYRHLWEGTTLELLRRKSSPEMMEWEYGNGFQSFRASFSRMSALLCTCRQIYQEASPVYRNLVELRIPALVLPIPEGFEHFVKSLDNRGDGLKPPFRGFKNISINVCDPVEHMPIIARLCPSMQSLTYYQASALTVPCYKHSLGRLERLLFEGVVKSQEHQRAVFGRLYPNSLSIRGALYHALIRSKSSLGKVRGLGFMKRVEIFWQQPLQSSSWEGKHKNNIVSHCPCPSAVLSVGLT